VFIFVGGGTGFVGRHLQKCLRKKGYNVKLISRNPQKDALTWVSMQKPFQLPSTLICDDASCQMCNTIETRYGYCLF